MSDQAPLNSDPLRDASSSIRGYVYQIYQSLYSWILLEPGEVLYLERAEDFDVHSSDQVTTVQVKDTAGSGNITLRTKGVVDALNNYWHNCALNVGVNIRLRYLTTSMPGHEQGDPFNGQKGLEYWNVVAKGSGDPGLLKQFIISLPISIELQQFLGSATNEQFVQKLVKSISWDMGEKPHDGIKLQIEEELSNFGKKHDLESQNLEEATDRYVAYIADLLCREGVRKLTNFEFQKKFVEFVSISVPKKEYFEVLKANTAFSQIMLQMFESNDPRISSQLQILSEPIPPNRYEIERNQLVTYLYEILIKNNGLILYGSTGLGKTSLARLVSERLTGTSGWVDFRGQELQIILNNLDKIQSELKKHTDIPCVILDDLDLSSHSYYSQNLIRLVSYLHQTGTRFIITSPYPCSTALLSKLWLEDISHQTVPYFSEEEVADLIHRVTDNLNFQEKWTKYIYYSTSGHPQLVDARIRRLISSNWQPSINENLFNTSDFEETRREARMRLLSEFPDEETRHLAYRLSISMGEFKRKFAIGIGRLDPRISKPGEAFEVLIGPWIEKLGTDKFRVSPLLRDAYSAIYGPGDVRQLHEYASLAPFEEKRISPIDASHGLLHAILGKSEGAATRWGISLLSSNLSDISNWLSLFDWLMHMSLEQGQYIFPDNGKTDVLLRLVQFKIAAASKKSQLAKQIVERVLDLIEGEGLDAATTMTQLLCCGVILNTIDVSIGSKLDLRLLQKLNNLTGLPEEISVTLKKPQHSITDGLDMIQMLFVLESSKIDSIDKLHEFLIAYEELPQDIKEKLQPSFDTKSFEFSKSLLTNAWHKSIERNDLVVQAAIEEYRFAEALGRKWRIPPFCTQALIAQSIMLDEYQNNKDFAISIILEQLESPYYVKSDLLLQAGKVSFHANQNEVALNYYQDGISRSELDNIEILFSCRNAGIAAGNIQKWDLASQYFRRALNISSRIHNLLSFSIGLQVEICFANWQQDNKPESLQGLAAVINRLGEIPPDESLKNRLVHATVSHLLGWLWSVAQDRKAHLGMVEPFPGMFSNQEPAEALKDHQVHSVYMIRKLLENVALIVDCELPPQSPLIITHPLPMLITTSNALSKISRLANGKDLIFGLKYMMELEELRAAVPRDSNPDGMSVTPGSIGRLEFSKLITMEKENYFSFAIILLSIISTNYHLRTAIPYPEWVEYITNINILTPDLQKVIDLLAGKRVDSNESVHENAAHALWKIREGAILPTDLFLCHFRIYNLVSLPGSGVIAGKAFVEMVSRAWKQVALEQPYSLTTPRLYAQSLLAACEEQDRDNLSKTANILKIASYAVNVKLAENAHAALDRDIATHGKVHSEN